MKPAKKRGRGKALTVVPRKAVARPAEQRAQEAAQAFKPRPRSAGQET
jgi:hypothetical protein